MKSTGLKSSARLTGRGAQWKVLLLAAVLCGLSWSFPVIAQQQESSTEQPGQDQVDGTIGERQALELVRARFPGNIISINEVRQDGRVRFRVRIDNEGNIYTVYVDQATGAVSRE